MANKVQGMTVEGYKEEEGIAGYSIILRGALFGFDWSLIIDPSSSSIDLFSR